MHQGVAERLYEFNDRTVKGPMIEGKLSKEKRVLTWIEWLCQIEGHEFLVTVEPKFVKLVVTSEDYEEVRAEWRNKYSKYEEAV